MTAVLVLFGTRRQGAVSGEITEKPGDGAMYVEVCQGKSWGKGGGEV